MKRLSALLITLIACSPALAAPQLYLCERPAWDGKEGCGPNNTHSTFSFLVETNDFDNEKPEYVFQGGKGCDASKKVKYRYRYAVSEDTITFKFAELPKAPRDKLWTTIAIDRETMKGILNNVEHSPDLTCRIEEQ